jgi:hypothetical protein
LTTFREVLDYVGQAANDDEIRALFTAGNARIKQLRALDVAEKAATLKVGDAILTSNLKPAYLNGLSGTILSVDRSGRKVTATLRLDDASALQARHYASANMLSGVPIGSLTTV